MAIIFSFFHVTMVDGIKGVSKDDIVLTKVKVDPEVIVQGVRSYLQMLEDAIMEQNN